MLATREVNPLDKSSPLLTKQQHQLYQKALLNHHKDPVGFDVEINGNCQAQGQNIACGDEISITIEVENHQIKALAFNGDSCAICRASASLMCAHLAKLTINEAEVVSQQLVTSIKENTALVADLAKLFSPLLAIQQFPVRKQCAILPWTTLSRALSPLCA